MDQGKYLKEKEFLNKHEDLLWKEETYWKQKYRELWMAEVDRNTKINQQYNQILKNTKQNLENQEV